MRINTNVSSITAQEAAVNTNNNIKSSLEKLSSGLRINKASDDASGLAIADKLRTQATSINQGVSNGNSAVTLLQIADKSMAEQSNILDTVKSKLIQANTDTTSADGRESIRKDIVKLLEQLDNIAEQTNYNGNVLLQASATDTNASAELSFQIGESKRDIVSNTPVQSNTKGLGSESKIDNGTTIAGSGGTLTVGSSGAITLTGKDSNGDASTENITLSGDVDEITLKDGMSISNVDADTKLKLDALVTSGKMTESSGTYTVTATGIDQTVDLSNIDTVEATIETQITASTTITAAVATGSVTAGQVVTTDATSGALFDTLNDATKFDKVDDTYKAKANIDLDLAVGETVKVYDLQSVATSGTTYNAGDTIKVNSLNTGGYLDLELQDTSKFSAGATAGEYVVLENFTAGDLNLQEGESITITQGIQPNLTSSTGSFVVSGIDIGGTAGFSTSGADTISLGSATGDAIVVTNGTDLTFSVEATGGTTGTSENYAVKAGDIISFTDATGAGAQNTELSESILGSTNFLNIGSSGGAEMYQAIADGNVSMDDQDSITIKRQLISNTPPQDITFSNTITTTTGSAAVTGAGNNEAAVTFKTDSSVSVTNNSTTSGDTLSVSGDGTNAVHNAGTQLSALAALGEGKLTKDAADSFQAVVDDAITDLNGYRGDIGSTQNQVESAVRNLMTQATNVKAAESIIRDVDYAQESANFNKQNIISQAGSYAISQANSTQQNVLRLLQ